MDAMLLACRVVLLFGLACVPIAAKAANDTLAPAETTEETAARQLIVLFNPLFSGVPAPSDIVDVVNGGAKPAFAIDLGSPNAARRLLQGVSALPQYQSSLDQPSLMARSLLERYILLTYSSSSVAQAAFVLLSADPKILSVEHNGVFSYSSIPNDRYFSQDLSQPATSNYQWGMQLLNLPTAWDKMRGSSYIGVIDSGIDCMAGTSPCLTHVDLRQNFRAQFSVNVSGGSPSLIVDSLGHGTHVAGIVAATPQFGAYSNGNSNSGVAGACWTCSLAVVKTDGTFATFATAMTFAVDHGSQVLNLSFGDGAKNTGRFGTCSDSKFSAMCTAIQYARDRDVIVVAAAGNRYEARIQFPASSPDVLAVGGVQPGGGFWNTGYGNSNVCVMGQPGDECGSNYGSNMAVVAPAADVVSTFPLNASYNSNVHCGDAFGPDAGSLNAYGDCTGTSMSTPHVTGIVGLLRSVNPLQNRNQVKAILTANTNPCSGMDSNKCGSGIPDASRAVNAALGGENVSLC